MQKDLHDIYSAGLRNLLREQGIPVDILAGEKKQWPDYPDMWANTYGWQDYAARDHVKKVNAATLEKYGAERFPQCDLIISEGVEITEVSYSQFQDTFSENSETVGINAYGGDKGSETEIYCRCGKFRGMTIRCEVSLGEALRHILALDSRKFTI